MDVRHGYMQEQVQVQVQVQQPGSAMETTYLSTSHLPPPSVKRYLPSLPSTARSYLLPYLPT